MRIAYVWASGDVYSNRYAAGWGACDPARDMKTTYNVGDLFVTEASLRLAVSEKVKVFQIESGLIDRHAEEINASFDIAFIRGANTVSDEPYAKTLADLLERLTVPVVTMGIGIQASDLAHLPSSADAIRLVKLLGKRCKTVGLRGRISADFFHKHGTENTRIMGCPSILRHNNRKLRIDKTPWEEIRMLGFSLTRGHNKVYARDAKSMWDVQGRLIKEIFREKKIIIFTQVELEEKAYAYRDRELISLAREKLYREGWFDKEMEAIYNHGCVFFSPFPTAYDMMVRSCDAIIGTRLHGNAMALACGVPPITLSIDLRVQEIYEFWKLPNLRIESASGKSVKAIYDEADFSEFNENFSSVYDNMMAYLDENDVVHRMSSDDI